MSIELVREGAEPFELTGIGWAFFLRLAERYVWMPAGTLPPEGRLSSSPWPRNYDSSDGQLVSASDAKSLGDALMRCNADPARTAVEAAVASDLSDILSREVGEPFPVEPPDDEGVFMSSLATFCRGGEFRIW
jgi:hypothetical protein